MYNHFDKQIALEITKLYLKDYNIEHKSLKEITELFNNTFKEVCILLNIED